MPNWDCSPTARHRSFTPVSLLGHYLEAEVGIERLAASMTSRLCPISLRIQVVCHYLKPLFHPGLLAILLAITTVRSGAAKSTMQMLRGSGIRRHEEQSYSDEAVSGSDCQNARVLGARDTDNAHERTDVVPVYRRNGWSGRALKRLNSAHGATIILCRILSNYVTRGQSRSEGQIQKYVN